MEDWQGCLTPLCQKALQVARDHVSGRGGFAITVEDYLLALLDADPAIPSFLKGRGVDMDELVRTVQCEQPIVTEVGGEGLLSSQLQYWFSATREIHDHPWLDWSHLMQVLTFHADRLAGKAYVAVLEQVGEWPMVGDESAEPVRAGEGVSAPVVVTDPAWATLSEDVAVALSSPRALLWVRAARGAGKTSWLSSMVRGLKDGYLALDLRRESEIMANDRAWLPSPHAEPGNAPVLILDNTSPADLNALMAPDQSLGRVLVPAYRGPILLLGPGTPEDSSDVRTLEHHLGRSLESVEMPAPAKDQRHGILVAHQPALEKRWGIEITRSALQFAASCGHARVTTPGGMLQWVERTAARLNLHAERGTPESLILADQQDNLRRQMLVALARQKPLDELEHQMARISQRLDELQRTHEARRQAGALRRMLAEDLRKELLQSVSGRYTMYGKEQN